MRLDDDNIKWLVGFAILLIVIGIGLSGGNKK